MEISQVFLLKIVSFPHLFLFNFFPFLYGRPWLTLHGPLLELQGLLFFVLLLVLVGEVEESDGVHDQVLLDFEVQRGIRGEGWGMVNFQDPGLQVAVQHYIKP